MADLRISELAALAGGDLAAGDLLAVADISASETKKITVQDTIGYGVTLIADGTIPGAKILFNAGQISGSSIATGGVDTTQLANDAVTPAKLADESTVDLVTTLPASGGYVGQLALDTDDSKIYCWDGSAWVSVKAAGSVNTIVGDTAGLVNLTIATSGDQVTITTSFDNTTGAAEFLAGPTATAGAVSYRQIASGDLPTAGSSGKGAVLIDGAGLAMTGDQLVVDNTVTANTSAYHVVQYTNKGLITDGRAITAADLPSAATGLKGAISPGTGLSMGAGGVLNHANAVGASTATKVSFDTEGHITVGESLEAADIPNLDAVKITSGEFSTARYANNSVTGEKLANYSVSQIGEVQPTADHVGQFFFNPLTRDLYLWDGNVYQPVGISAGEIILAGTYDASTNLLDSVTPEGTAAGFNVGSSLPAAATGNNRHYVVVSQSGTGVLPAPAVLLEPPDILLSNGTSFVLIETSETITAQIASNVGFTPTGSVGSTNVQGAIAEVDSEKLAKAGGTMTGELLIGTTGSLVFEGSTDNAFETTLTVTDPTADRTITFKDATGTVAFTSDLDDGTY